MRKRPRSSFPPALWMTIYLLTHGTHLTTTRWHEAPYPSIPSSPSPHAKVCNISLTDISNTELYHIAAQKKHHRPCPLTMEKQVIQGLLSRQCPHFCKMIRVRFAPNAPNAPPRLHPHLLAAPCIMHRSN